MRRALVERYGNVPRDGESDAERFRTACINMKLTLSDGVPCEVVPPFLFVGGVGAAYNGDRLQAAGITHVLNVTPNLQNLFPGRFTYLRVAVDDAPDADLAAHFDACTAFIDAARDAGGRVLVHCYQGVSRSVAVVCAYLVVTMRVDAATALDMVRRAGRPTAGPNSGFLRALRALEQHHRTAATPT